MPSEDEGVDEGERAGCTQYRPSLDMQLSDIITFNKLGSGASGTVKKAAHKPTKKVIALKEVNVKNDSKARDAILSELHMLGQCDHKNVIKSYGAFLTPQGVTIALEYMNAGCLASIL